MRRMMTFGLVFLVAYGAIVALIYFMQRSLLYFPPGPNPQPPPGLEKVEIPTDDGLVLSHWYRAPAPGAALVVMFHGNASSVVESAILLPLLKDGQGALLAEYRGYGGNPGRPGEAELIADGYGLFRWLEDQGVAPQRIVLYGRSLGSGVAVRLAAETDVAGLVLESPFSSVTDVAEVHYPILPVRWLIRDRWNSHAVIGRVRAPLLILHGERDRVVPIRFGRKLFAAANEPKLFAAFPGAGHNDLLADPKAAAGVRAFLARFRGREEIVKR